MSPAATAPTSRLRSTSKTAGAAITLEPDPRIETPGEGLVSRTAVVRRLTTATGGKLAVIVAPPGYGKSSLLREWSRCDQRRFLWLALPDRDSHDRGLDVTATAVRAAVRSLRSEARKFVLALDDAHLVAPGVLRLVVDVTMEEVAGGSTIALASRTEPMLPLGRWRANRQLVEVRVDDLVMTPAEASILLRRAGLELGSAAVQALVRRTEGWPAALYLAALSMRDQADAAEAVSDLRGDDHRLAEYFRDEVLPGLSANQMNFAVRTSVLDELSAPVCDAVLDCQGSGRTLTELERCSALLRPLDRAHGRYRWHGLFRHALEFEMCRSEPDLPRALHLRASSWYHDRGDSDQAISHAVRAHDPDVAGDLLCADIVAYVSQGRNDIVQRWLAWFSQEELAGHAPLAISAAYSFLAAGDLARARHCTVAAAAAMERWPNDPRRASLAPGLAAIEAMVAPSGVAGMAQAAASACDIEPRDSPWRPIHLFLHGTALHLSGDQAAAEALLGEAADLSAATAPIVSSLCLAQAAMIAIERRDWDAAADLTDRAESTIEQHGNAECPLSALACAACAAVRAHHGRADEAKRDLRRGINLLAALGDFIPWYGAEARMLLARASLGLADVVGARTLLAEASRLSRRVPGAVIFEPWFDDAWSYLDTLAETSLAGPSSLTIAELRVLRFLPSHRSFREIAIQLGVSANTVKTQAHAVYRKLGAASRSEAVARGSDAGLLGQ